MTRITRTISALLVAGVLAGAGTTAVTASALATTPGTSGHVAHAGGAAGPADAFDWE
jgi:hypothetical protein